MTQSIADHREAAPAAPAAPAETYWRSEGRVLFGLSVPWLGHQRGNSEDELQRYFVDQLLFLRVLAQAGKPDQRLQLRYLYKGGGRSRALRCLLFGSAESQDSAAELRELLFAALPRALPVDGMSGVIGRRLQQAFPATSMDVVEVQRALRRPDDSSVVLVDPGTRGLLVPWVWTPNALEAGLAALAQQEAGAALAVNVQPAELTRQDRLALQQSLGELEDLARNASSAAPVAPLQEELRRTTRDMTEACLTMRVYVAAPDTVPDFLPHLIGGDLARGLGERGAYGTVAHQVVRASSPAESGQLQRCFLLKDDSPAAETSAARGATLLHKFSPREANVAFRFPIFAQEVVVADW